MRDVSSSSFALCSGGSEDAISAAIVEGLPAASSLSSGREDGETGIPNERDRAGVGGAKGDAATNGGRPPPDGDCDGRAC